MKIQDLTELYNKLLNIISGIDKTSSMPTIQISYLFTNLNKYQNYINNVVKQPVFENELSDKTLELIAQTYASLKTIIDIHKPIEDVLFLDNNTTDNLLLSFGFTNTNLPLIIKKKLLSILIHLYKEKGSLDSLNKAAKIVKPNLDISEVYLETINNEPKFTWTINLDIGDYTYSKFRITRDYNTHDKHWWLTKQNAIQLGYRKALTPYVALTEYNNYNNLETIIAYIKRKAYENYQLLLENKNQEYLDTKEFKVSTLPESFNFLEFWFMLRYFYIKINGYDFTDDLEGRNYFYTEDNLTVDTVINEYKKYYSNRYQLESKEVVTKTKLKEIVIKPETVYDTFKYYVNDTNAKIIPLPNNLIAIIQNNKITVINLLDKSIKYEINTDISIKDYYYYVINDTIILEGGYNTKDNSYNQYKFEIDLSKQTIKKYIIDTQFKFINDLNKQLYVYNIFTNNGYIVKQKDRKTIGVYKKKINRIPIKLLEINNYQLINDIIYFNSNSIIVLAKNITNNKINLLYIELDTKQFHKINIDKKLQKYIDKNKFLIQPFSNSYIITFFNDKNNLAHNYLIDSETYSLIPLSITYAYNNDLFSDKLLTNSKKHSISLSTNTILLQTNNKKDNRLEFVFFTLIEDRIIKLILDIIDYKCNDDNIRCLRQILLNERQQKFETDKPKLPQFNSVEELHNFLMKLIPKNIEQFDYSSVETKKTILYDVLSTVSIYLGTNLANLLPDYEYKILMSLINVFKPIQTRVLFYLIPTLLHDTVGDWAALSDDLILDIASKNSERIILNEEIGINIIITTLEKLELRDELHTYIHALIFMYHNLYIIGLDNQFIAGEYDSNPYVGLRNIVLEQSILIADNYPTIYNKYNSNQVIGTYITANIESDRHKYIVIDKVDKKTTIIESIICSDTTLNNIDKCSKRK